MIQELNWKQSCNGGGGNAVADFVGWLRLKVD